MLDQGRLGLGVAYLKESLLHAFTDRAGAVDRLRDLAAASYSEGHQDLSVRSLRRAASLAERPAELYVELGALHYSRGEYADSRDTFRRAVAADLGHTEALRGLAMSHHMLGEYDQASYYYLAALAGDPDDYDSRLNLGLVYHVQGRLDDAIEQLRQACSVGGAQNAYGLYYAYLALGRALYDRAEFEQGTASLERAVELESANAESYRFLGMSQEALGRWKEAADSYRRAIELDPNEAHAHLHLANLLVEDGEGELALEPATRAAEIFQRRGEADQQARAYWALGWAHYNNGEWRKSAEVSRASLELDPTLAAVRFNLGLALLHDGQTDEARRVYDEAINRFVAIWDLETHGIDDLKVLLAEDPDVPGAAEILKKLEAKRQQLVSEVEYKAATELRAPQLSSTN
jgi:tetratricopeptide (TPR) repeat protein